MKSHVIFVKFHTLLQSTDFVVVLVLVVVLDKILIPEDEHEDEYEKYQIRSHAYALRPLPYTLQIPKITFSSTNFGF